MIWATLEVVFWLKVPLLLELAILAGELLAKLFGVGRAELEDKIVKLNAPRINIINRIIPAIMPIRKF